MSNGYPPARSSQTSHPLAADIFWTLASPETYEALVARRGWTPEAFEAWIAEALAELLLA